MKPASSLGTKTKEAALEMIKKQLIDVRTIRAIDYYLGIPLCFICSFSKKIARLLTRKKQRGRPQNILFIELSEMGSAILADPAIRKLKDRINNANIFFATFERNRESLHITGAVSDDRVFTISDGRLLDFILGTIRFFRWTREKRIDTVIDLELFSRFTALLTGFSGADLTCGFHAFHNEGLYRGDFLTHKVVYNAHQHMAKNFIALVNALLSDSSQTPYCKTIIADEEIIPRKITVDKEVGLEMRRRIRNRYPGYDMKRHQIVIFNANASSVMPLRRWPQEHYVSLAKILLHDYENLIILLIGPEHERQDAGALADAVRHERCINFAGSTRFDELPALYSVACLLISNDSGPAHVAAVTEIQSFTFFGPETPELYGPLGNTTPIYAGLACSPCVSAANHRNSPCTDNACLRFIAPKQVAGIVKPKLDLLFSARLR